MSSQKKILDPMLKSLETQLSHLLGELALLQKSDADDSTISEKEQEIKRLNDRLRKYVVNNPEANNNKIILENEIKKMELALDKAIKSNWSKDKCYRIRKLIDNKKSELNQFVSNNVEQDKKEIENDIAMLIQKRNFIDKQIYAQQQRLKQLCGEDININDDDDTNNNNTYYEPDDVVDDDDQEAVWNRHLTAKQQYLSQYGVQP